MSLIPTDRSGAYGDCSPPPRSTGRGDCYAPHYCPRGHLAGCERRVFHLVARLDAANVHAAPGPACHFTRSPGAADLLSIALNTPVGPGLLWRRSLFEDRPPPVLVKPAQLYARREVTPGAGLYRLHCRAPRPLFGGLSMFPPGTSRRATIYRSGCSARDASFTRPYPKYSHNTGHRTSPVV